MQGCSICPLIGFIIPKSHAVFKGSTKLLNCSSRPAYINQTCTKMINSGRKKARAFLPGKAAAKKPAAVAANAAGCRESWSGGRRSAGGQSAAFAPPRLPLLVLFRALEEKAPSLRRFRRLHPPHQPAQLSAQHLQRILVALGGAQGQHQPGHPGRGELQRALFGNGLV